MKTEKEKAAYRKTNKYLNLTDEQCDMHGDIMAMDHYEWPMALREYCLLQRNLYGFCTDHMMSWVAWVAEWLRMGNKIEDPFEGETDEQAEAGRIAALKMLGYTIDVFK